MYQRGGNRTSGCPNNQKRCWKSNKSPPEAGSKKEVLKFLSRNNKEIATAKIGKVNNNKKAVTRIVQGNKEIENKGRIDKFRIVVIKFIAPKREEIPAKCKDKILKSTEILLLPNKEERDGYKVQPVPTPLPINVDINNKNKEGGNNQKLILFSLGNAVSNVPINIGT